MWQIVAGRLFILPIGRVPFGSAEDRAWLCSENNIGQ